jgi:hypothetical protein
MPCSHRACKCRETPVVKAGKAYCSESCATAATVVVDSCSCGHPECPQVERPSPNPPGERPPARQRPPDPTGLPKEKTRAAKEKRS